MLTSPVHVVAIDEDLVILSVEADAYYCLPAAADAWAALTSGESTPDARELAETMLEAGLGGPGHTRPPPHDRPGRRLDRDRQDALSHGDLRNLLGAWLDLQRRYHRRSFSDILRYARTAAPQAAARDEAELRRLCAVFDRAVVWLPVSSKCLERSFLLLRFLHRSNCDATWVFGVRVWPFLAHCWLRVGDAVLDDWPERLATYTPILEV